MPTPITAPTTGSSRAGHVRLRRWLAYLLVSACMLGQTALDPLRRLVGFPNVDAQDTVMLRGLVLRMLGDPSGLPGTDGIYFPVGFDALHLMPNLLDHLTAAPLVALVPFPLADNVWWWLVLALNGWAAHRLGRRLGGSEAAGALAGLAFMCSEPIAREANLHHAPQAMVFWAPLYLDALFASRDPRDRRAPWLAGLWLGFGALTYWYLGMFLVLGTAPLLLSLGPARLAKIAGVSMAISAPALLPQLLQWGDLPLTSGVSAPPPAEAPASYDVVPDAMQFIAQHGNDPLFWLRRVPLDLSNRVSLALLGAAVLGARRTERGPRIALWAMAGLAAVMLLGPYLRWGADIVAWGDGALSLPFRWAGRLHPVLARLTWPERWGVLVPLALVALAARAPKPAWFAAAILLENLVVSGNLPLQSTSVRHQLCWRALSDAPGALIELPLRRPGLRAPRVGVHQRLHGRPIVNPVLLPPGAEAPAEWSAWLEQEPMMVYLRAFESGQHPPDPGADAVRSLRAAGVSALVVDVEPGAVLTAGGLNRFKAGLGRHLGRPVDLGCALVWWIDDRVPAPPPIEDGDAWRVKAAKWKERHPAPELDTLIEPTWDAVQRKGGG